MLEGHARVPFSSFYCWMYATFSSVMISPQLSSSFLKPISGNTSTLRIANSNTIFPQLKSIHAIKTISFFRYPFMPGFSSVHSFGMRKPLLGMIESYFQLKKFAGGIFLKKHTSRVHKIYSQQNVPLI